MPEITISVSGEMGFTDGLPGAQRRWAMFSYLVGLAMSVLDGNIANTALPSIATQLHASPGSIDLGRERIPADRWESAWCRFLPSWTSLGTRRSTRAAW